MSLNKVFDIAGSGMNAQSLRLNTTASNLANAQSVSSSIDETYRARKPVFAPILEGYKQGITDNQGYQNPVTSLNPENVAGEGVQTLGIVESNAELKMRYEPNNPAANEDGYVFYPNVNVVEEMTDMIAASRSFQTNVEVMNTAKQMVQRALTLGQGA
ncbi:flagellar basal body rod protein FlgC [Terasakiispira papahanaumokuakeensis]|uniref:Flagellar basal-body rod protein FlgC n=1 Tax=Terasakiispira papahanaumokuakeensis TaxID=197479 RepID=A0A1E2VB87_9GAMM|nr:flagellar basal body rod protein FlgC [Terasakiispira papahanaumokuakeensis]ODC04183.1 flagellar basal body rod protein FlgC [Terasakiispira papahanaumokuakeensis]